jgi:histidine triad (HIT) family protein
MTYDPSNPFAKILRGELPSTRVYEDEHTVAIMDIMPRCEGHTLVIPKAPVRNLLDAPPTVLAACLATVQKVARAQMQGLGATGITINQYNETAGGQVVFHLHYHVLPRFDGAPLGPHTGKMGDAVAIAMAAEKIRAAIG